MSKLCISSHQMAGFRDQHAIFFTLALFSVIKGLAIAATLDVGFVKLSSDCFCGNVQDEY